jgi:hypothetical protein
MKNHQRQASLRALLSFLAVISAALPAVAACADADCCLDAALESSCNGCTSIDCNAENPELATIGPTTVLEPPVGSVEVLVPQHAAQAPSAIPDPAPSICACLESTVLRF